MDRVLKALLVLVVAATTARAADVPITGLKLIMVDKTAVAAGAKAVFVAKDTAISKGAGENPAGILSQLAIAYDGNTGLFEMPPGPQWLVNKATVAKYVNNAAPSGGSIKVSVIKPASLIKVVAKSLGESSIDISTAPTGTVYVSHMVINDDEGFRHCTQFGTCVHKLIAGGSGYKLVCKGDSSPDPTCAAAPPPECCSITDPAQLCGWLDAFACTMAGGTPGGPASTCDSATGMCAGSATAGGCCEGFPTPLGSVCLAGPDLTVDACPGGFNPAGLCAPDGSCS